MYSRLAGLRASSCFSRLSLPPPLMSFLLGPVLAEMLQKQLWSYVLSDTGNFKFYWLHVCSLPPHHFEKQKFFIQMCLSTNMMVLSRILWRIFTWEDHKDCVETDSSVSADSSLLRTFHQNQFGRRKPEQYHLENDCKQPVQTPGRKCKVWVRWHSADRHDPGHASYCSTDWLRNSKEPWQGLIE